MNRRLNKKIIEISINNIFDAIGENRNREGLTGTPDRIARMFEELFRGYDEDQKPKVTTFKNGSDGIKYDQMIIDSGEFYSMCEHHMMPFMGKYYFAYIPNEKGLILGLSKVARIVDYYSAKLQIQERLVHEIIEELWNALSDETQPEGMMLVMKAEHLCKTMRGAKKHGLMTTSKVKGCFEDAAVRNEFLNLIDL